MRSQQSLLGVLCFMSALTSRPLQIQHMLIACTTLAVSPRSRSQAETILSVWPPTGEFICRVPPAYQGRRTVYFPCGDFGTFRHSSIRYRSMLRKSGLAIRRHDMPSMHGDASAGWRGCGVVSLLHVKM
mmetsp:Transcript_18979/g.43612  ORF Transcript_18979/g.43612 Transcript_18979/m.43612 type:complete len:129 (-) Transcript_18979:400-786(-)